MRKPNKSIAKAGANSNSQPTGEFKLEDVWDSTNPYSILGLLEALQAEQITYDQLPDKAKKVIIAFFADEMHADGVEVG